MSIDAEKEQRDRKNREAWDKERLARLRSSLQRFVGKTCWFDVATPTNQLAPRLLGRVLSVDEDTVDLIDMSDASQPPNEKPRRTIGFGEIRSWNLT